MSLLSKICLTAGMLLLVAECVWLLVIVIRQKLRIEWLENELKHSDEWGSKLLKALEKSEGSTSFRFGYGQAIDPADWWKDDGK